MQWREHRFVPCCWVLLHKRNHNYFCYFRFHESRCEANQVLCLLRTLYTFPALNFHNCLSLTMFYLLLTLYLFFVHLSVPDIIPKINIYLMHPCLPHNVPQIIFLVHLSWGMHKYKSKYDLVHNNRENRKKTQKMYEFILSTLKLGETKVYLFS